MSQVTIPEQFERYLQQKTLQKLPTSLNEIVFAYIPNLDDTQPIDRQQGLPDQQYWVYQQAVDQVGKVGDNAVVYSVVIPAVVEPFTFNAMYLHDTESPDSCAVIVHKPVETKEVGMTLTKSMLMQFDGAAEAAQVTVNAETWQIDFSVRLAGIDDDVRLTNLDYYGSFAILNGFDCTNVGEFVLTSGLGYVGGLRAQLKADFTAVPAADVYVWLDAFRDGSPLSTFENTLNVRLTNEELVNYIDSKGRAHYVAALYRIDADGNVFDLRQQLNQVNGVVMENLILNVATQAVIINQTHELLNMKLNKEVK
ncbi:phage tail protein [Photobacterium leiognathi subsp. mandapamensis]|uniref:phage tail-collar fiber domain-containing protein n=1 Tax=Photobacterium leiognathi TaxID=553611 RepID=UPI003AF3CA91